MEAKDVIAFEKQVAEIVGKECRFEYTLYDGANRVENKPHEQTDGLIRDKLADLPKAYHRDYVIYLKMNEKDMNGYDLVAHMRTYQLPGCCGACVSSASTVQSQFRRKGINTILNKFRIEFAKHLGYTILMCSDLNSNVGSKKTLVKNGWKDIYQFKNRRTNNLLDLSIINLYE